MNLGPVIHHSKPFLEEDDILAVNEVLRSNRLEEGEKVKELEQYLASFFEKSYCVATSSGFGAIHLILAALEIDENSEVIIPSYTCAALLNPIRLLGGIPVIVDIEKDGFNIDLDAVRDRINKNTKVIIVPHMYGYPADIEGIKKLGIHIIEDCAHSFGEFSKDLKTGQFGDSVICSFYASKTFCAGDGGAVITNDKELAKKIRILRHYGGIKKNPFISYNYRLTNIPAALALSQSKKNLRILAERKKISLWYDEEFEGLKLINIEFKKKKYSLNYRYLIEVEGRDSLRAKLRQNGVYCGVGTLEGLHELMKLPTNLFPNTERMLARILSLPLYPGLERRQILRITSLIKSLI